MVSVTPFFFFDRCGISGVAKRLVGNEMRLEVWERHGSGCNAAGCRSNQAGGGVPQMYANGGV